MSNSPGISINLRDPMSLAWLTTLVGIPLLSLFGRPLQHWAHTNFDSGIIAWVIGLLLIAIASAGLYWLRRREPLLPWHQHLLLAIGLIVAIVAITLLLPRAEERLHFVTFGLFGFLSLRILPARYALLAIITWSGGDELFQAWLPDRVGDWRDVWMNLSASMIGMGIARLGAKGA